VLIRVIVAVALAALHAAPAAAESDREQSSRHLERGISYYEMGKYKLAVEEFERAYVLHATDSLLFNLAQAHRKLDNCTEAVRYYERYLERSPRSPRAREVRKLLPDLRRACEIKFVRPSGVSPEPEPREPPRPRPDLLPPPPTTTTPPPPTPPAPPTPAPTQQVATTTAATTATTTAAPAAPAAEDAAVAAGMPERALSRLRVRAATSLGGLSTAAGSATVAGITAAAAYRPRSLPVELGGALQISSFGWDTHGVDARSGVVSALATAGMSRPLSAVTVEGEAGAGLVAISHLLPGNPLRETGDPRSEGMTIRPAAQLGLFGSHAFGDRLAVRAGATALVAALGDIGGGAAIDLRLVVGLELRP
jgi:hypothetical protein